MTRVRETPMERREQEDAVDRLLDRWESAREQGEPLAVDDLCREHADLHPEVQRRIDALLSLSPFLRPGENGAAPAEGTPGRIGAYDVIGELARGGMGIVYRCRQQHPRREVAVKIIRPGRASDETLKRFQLEAQVLGLLHHPGIAQVYDAGTADFGAGTRPFLVMELIEGLPIDRHADEHRLDAVQRLKLLVEVCRAVDYAHKKGVIHRDLKPSNILVDEQGQPKVLDFGIARIIGHEFETLAGGFETLTPVGSLPYMSPEQAVARPEDVDARTDVYSLGVVAYKLLAGRLPHDARNRSLLEFVRVVTDQAARPLGQFNRAYRGDLETIVAKALEKERDHRYQSAAEFAVDLCHYLAGEPVTARPVSQMGQFWRWCKRRRLVTGLAASLLAALPAPPARIRLAFAAPFLRAATVLAGWSRTALPLPCPAALGRSDCGTSGLVNFGVRFLGMKKPSRASPITPMAACWRRRATTGRSGYGTQTRAHFRRRSAAIGSA